MSFLDRKKEDAYTIIIGCGRLGANLANELSESGSNVLIMDSDKSSFRKLSSAYGGLAVEADGTDFAALKEAEIEKADAVVAVTNNDNVNIMAAQIARYVFNVKHVIARLYDPERECVYKELEIDTICPAVLSSKEIDRILDKFRAQERNEVAA